MILDGIFEIIFNIINTLLTPIENINWDFDVSVLDPILQFISMALWIIPIGPLLPIFYSFAALMMFRILVSLIKTLVAMIPFA